MKTIGATPLSSLLGIWNTIGTVYTNTGELILHGTDSYEIVLDGNFILHRAHVMIGDEKSETIEIIGPYIVNGSTPMQYFNPKGESGKMRCEIADNVFSISGDGLKFNGLLSDDHCNITGKWYMEKEEGAWTEYIDLKLVRQ